MKEYETFMETPIPPQRVKTWNWDESMKKKIEECGERLVMTSLAPDKILVSSQYFIQRINGSLPECYVRETVHQKIVEAAKLLPSGYRFVMLDCWRPLSVQQSLFDILKDDLKEKYPSESEEVITQKTLTYVALPSSNPVKPSPHNTGGAVDLTIVDENGLFLEMGTDYDDSTLKASTTYFENQLAEEVKLNSKEIEALKNRRMLYHIMTSVGFTNFVDEWWHFDYGNQNWAWISGNDHAVYGRMSPVFPWNKEIK